MDDAKQPVEHAVTEKNKCSKCAFPVATKEKEAMGKLKTGIIAYLHSQRGILPHLLRQHPLLGTRIATWATGEKPLLIIGGEPGNGKSLLMGELVLRYNELALHYHNMLLPLILISYDQIHYLFLKRLARIGTSSSKEFLPEGETHPEARALITEIMWHTLLFALNSLMPHSPIILETPLIDHRGEDLLYKIASLNFQMQIFIMYSPAMRMRSLYDEKRLTERSAHPLAMQKIHDALLQQRGVMTYPKEAQDDALAKSWERWVDDCEGMVLAWNPEHDEEGFLYTKMLLEEMHIRTDPLSPVLLEKYTLCIIEQVLKMIPDLEVFASKVQEYGRR